MKSLLISKITVATSLCALLLATSSQNAQAMELPDPVPPGNCCYRMIKKGGKLVKAGGKYLITKGPIAALKIGTSSAVGAGLATPLAPALNVSDDRAAVSGATIFGTTKAGCMYAGWPGCFGGFVLGTGIVTEEYFFGNIEYWTEPFHSDQVLHTLIAWPRTTSWLFNRVLQALHVQAGTPYYIHEYGAWAQSYVNPLLGVAEDHEKPAPIQLATALNAPNAEDLTPLYHTLVNKRADLALDLLAYSETRVKDIRGKTPILILAARLFSLDLIMAIVESANAQGVTLATEDANGNIFHAVAQGGRLDVANYLCDFYPYADYNKPNADGNTPASHASLFGNKHVQLFFKRKTLQGSSAKTEL